jgi:hypothetical protein
MEEQSHNNEQKLSEKEGIKTKVSLYVELNRTSIIILFHF